MHFGNYLPKVYGALPSERLRTGNQLSGKAHCHRKMTAILFSLEGISLSFGGVLALTDIDLAVDQARSAPSSARTARARAR